MLKVLVVSGDSVIDVLLDPVMWVSLVQIIATGHKLSDPSGLLDMLWRRQPGDSQERTTCSLHCGKVEEKNLESCTLVCMCTTLWVIYTRHCACPSPLCKGNGSGIDYFRKWSCLSR
eukprot:TRINITY_DN68_c0_g4_i1.p1 TRINITY_DN68_c0_g4~~TRINITY_DN68_c0_g4_i1.p1  ORF type:complete len:117 (-),score=5.48 TRINITY_DN68_c0_g4_i1:253-603(-)